MAAGANLRHYILHHHALIPVHVEEINLSLASRWDLASISIRWMDRRVGGRLRGNLGILSGAITLDGG